MRDLNSILLEGLITNIIERDDYIQICLLTDKTYHFNVLVEKDFFKNYKGIVIGTNIRLVGRLIEKRNEQLELFESNHEIYILAEHLEIHYVSRR